VIVISAEGAKSSSSSSSYASFPPGVDKALLKWEGTAHRGSEQYMLNLIQGRYETLNNPWLQSFASRNEPFHCSSSSSSSSSVAKKVLFVHFEPENMKSVKVELSRVADQAEQGITCMITSSQGPFKTCDELLAAKGCFIDVLPRSTCIDVVNLGPICYSSAQHGKGSILIWPRNKREDPSVEFGKGSSRSAAFVFNQFMYEMMDDQCQSSQCLRNVLGGSSNTPIVVCLSRPLSLPVSKPPEDMIVESGLQINDWVNRASRLLQRNPRLASLGCFPKFPGHTYVDTLEYYNVPLK